MHDQSLKQLLTKCQLLLEEGDFDTLNETIKKVMELDLSGLSREEFEEAINIIDFLIQRAQEKREDIAQKLANFQRFKGYIR